MHRVVPWFHPTPMGCLTASISRLTRCHVSYPGVCQVSPIVCRRSVELEAFIENVFFLLSNLISVRPVRAAPTALGHWSRKLAVCGLALGKVFASLASAAPAHAVGAPTVTGVAPATGPAGGGTPVTITGTGFDATSTVKFGAVAATAVTCSSATSCAATSPAGTGTAEVTVTTAGATSATSPADQFVYQAAGAGPTVTVVGRRRGARPPRSSSPGWAWGSRASGGVLLMAGRRRRNVHRG